jgi:peptide/nickel transport system permease protein
MSAEQLPLRFRIGLRRRAGTTGSAWRQPLAIIGMVIAGAWILIAIFVPLLAPYDPLLQSSHLVLPPSPAHLFGTDELGRDVLSRRSPSSSSRRPSSSAGPWVR